MSIFGSRTVAAIVLLLALCFALAFAAELLLAFGRPPQALPLGTVQWFYEAGIAVDRVTRVSTIGNGSNARHAKGEFYIVHARVVAPFGLRPEWHDSDAEVRTFAGTGGTMHDLHFAVDEAAQAALDRQTHRPGPVHMIRGAEQHEDLVFDLPRDVEQPAILFAPVNDPMGVADIIFGHFWQPHRFNLRYD